MKSNLIKTCSLVLVAAGTLMFQNCQPYSGDADRNQVNQSSISGNALDCAAPWDPLELIPNGTSVKAYSSANVVEGMQCISEQRSCQEGTLSGTFVNETCEILPLVLEEKQCKVYWASGASAASKVADVDACLAYFSEIKKNNPNGVFSQVDFDGKPILVIETNPPPTTKATYKGYFITGGKEQLFIQTKDISEADALKNCKTNSTANPKLGIKCVWGTKTIMTKAEPAKTMVCKISFKSGGAVSTKVKTKALCESYYKEIKKNNPKNPILKVELDGKKIL